MSAQQPAKRQDQRKVIGTHNGTFHCDEALAVYLLRQTEVYRDAAVKRSRDPAVLNTCDIVVDVGAVYDESKQLFDHHQRGFTEVFGHGFTTKLSSAGLIYKHFGKEIIANKFHLALEEPKVETLWLKLYKEFIEAIDGIDNGVSQYPNDVEPKYRNRTDLSSRVGWLNPAWNESVESSGVDALFEKASSLTGEEFVGRLTYYGGAWLPARDLVAAALYDRTRVDGSGRIILFTQFAPWKEHLFELETEADVPVFAKPFYVIYPDETGGNWRIQAVPVSPESFESRKALPEVWRGVRDDELSRVTGIDGGIFVHASGFIGGNQTKDGALAMAKKALEL
ncbi:metal-dependent protein hydrolase [Auriscalpium vulgare]|uniref:Metal-dependent protein hydrolase n=1 Tax=Auriscalpium vulgare TaxID=40419 RepID=A0ACB8RH02_9AGAM|nr:metal-dependent protein hydrolase [Auriscalpium vulgare]